MGEVLYWVVLEVCTALRLTSITRGQPHDHICRGLERLEGVQAAHVGGSVAAEEREEGYEIPSICSQQGEEGLELIMLAIASLLAPHPEPLSAKSPLRVVPVQMCYHTSGLSESIFILPLALKPEITTRKQTISEVT